MNTTVKKIVEACQRASCLMAFGAIIAPVAGNAAEFNEMFLKKGDGPVELTYFERGSSIAPGIYDVDVSLNKRRAKRESIAFKEDASGEVRPMITYGLLKSLGVDLKRLEREHKLEAGLDDNSLVRLDQLVDGAAASFDVGTLTLDISIPQLYVPGQIRGLVDPSLWDEGVAAAYSNYQANFSHDTNSGYRSDYGYLGLRNGVNIGAWRFRNESALSWRRGSPSEFSVNRSYVERDLKGIKGRLAAGEVYSSSEIFDSVRFLGVQVNSDTGMLSDNEVGYAPVVRGIAQSNAVVEVRQNGYVIYSASVAPGAFEFRDIYPSGSNGDLEIRIIESDGSTRTFRQSYSYLPVMIRRGTMRYAFSAGQYRGYGQSRPKFAQGSLVYGVSDNLTGYGGLIGAERYAAIALGVGYNSPLGGISFDVTHSQSSTQGRKSTGQSLRFLYSKTLTSTDTTFTMVGYRYSTDGYRTFSQHVDDLDRQGGGGYRRQKSRVDLNINQSLGARGSIYASVGDTSYWNRGGSSRNIQLGYSGALKNLSYSVSVAHTRDTGAFGRADTQFSASVSIPIGGGARSHRAFANTVASTSGDVSVQAGVNGFLNEANTVNYSVQGDYRKDSGGSGGVGLGWDTPMAKLTSNYTQSGHGKHVDVGAAGSIVAHSGGITLGQTVGETFAIAEVPGVRGARFSSSSSISTDRRGYAIVPYAQPYRYNWLNIDTESLGFDTDLTDNSKSVVPTRGAIVKARFTAETGRRIQFDVTGSNGDKVPFGATAYDENDKVLGMVDNASRVLVFGVKDQGRLSIRWSEGSCEGNYALPERKKSLAYERVAMSCKMAGR
ncbi:fimbrial biogenesis outer membrane usher protein [Burkholderia cenocepacia]|uniref:fimbria/pilus outer membrane usher protein n=1 Tax=Burkholderia cenocepacia TaxID=95486 RepID=UPI001BA32886|nr:fimbria/pilus outer membrane usher protein [Burkholderia cenocepacia]MBR8207448.1 fimbrial biogenesis outer membrane usher protein [Burkholderia cenocepacia]